MGILPDVPKAGIRQITVLRVCSAKIMAAYYKLVPVTGMEGDLVMLEQLADDIIGEHAIAAEPQDSGIDYS